MLRSSNLTREVHEANLGDRNETSIVGSTVQGDVNRVLHYRSILAPSKTPYSRILHGNARRLPPCLQLRVTGRRNLMKSCSPTLKASSYTITSKLHGNMQQTRGGRKLFDRKPLYQRPSQEW
ncbi:hypothetical protein Y032_0246g20 [Ancylostoma ceylanicum]|uniref:Uncharacterized protein n=1 Tax=Ancylostoma ceylanicum TaxID=53326 RepID=A0A016SDU3_9BILA|nr:hypothetical protein Y032_0246g20 [Ancylostoma ceylanicum]